MDNVEQNKRLTEAVEGIMAAREQAAPMMDEVFTRGMDVVFLKGRKRERKVGMVLSFDSEANNVLVKVGRGVEMILVEDVVEIVEPAFATSDDEKEPVDDDADDDFKPNTTRPGG